MAYVKNGQRRLVLPSSRMMVLGHAGIHRWAGNPSEACGEQHTAHQKRKAPASFEFPFENKFVTEQNEGFFFVCFIFISRIIT